MTPPRLLFLGDAAVSTGFARCTHAACDAFHAAGWDVSVLGINYFGDPHPYPYTIYPCYQPLDQSRNFVGLQRLPRLIDRLSPDLVIILQDPWSFPVYFDYLDTYAETVKTVEDRTLTYPPIIGWVAVDSRNHPRSDRLNRLAHLVTWTRFGADELIKGGYSNSSSVVPLGVDPLTFRPDPRGKLHCRDLVLPPQFSRDGFLVGRVDRNQPRKRWDLTMAVFSEWLHNSPSNPDACLYCHTAPTGERSTDLVSLARYYGLHGRCVLQVPDIGRGIGESSLRATYTAFDAYLTTTQGEGWGLPVLEAMACGVPTIVPKWSALEEWTEGVAIQVECRSEAPTAPLDAAAYTVGGVIDVDKAAEALETLYTSETIRRQMSKLGREKAESLPWSAVGPQLVEIAEAVLITRRGEGVEIDTAEGVVGVSRG